MNKNFPQNKIVHKTYRTYFFYCLWVNTVIFAICFLLTSTSSAELKCLSDTQLKKTIGQQGMTDYSVVGDVARLFVDVHIESAGQINSLKAGYYNNGSAGGAGWDNNWTNIQLGSDSDPVQIDGLVFMADFNDINSSSKKLQRVVIGTNRVQGTVSGQINSFTGVYNDALTGGSGNAVYGNRSALGNTSFNFNSNKSETENMGFFMVLDLEGTHPGINFVAGYDENTIQTSMPSGDWWESP